MLLQKTLELFLSAVLGGLTSTFFYHLYENRKIVNKLKTLNKSDIHQKIHKIREYSEELYLLLKHLDEQEN